MRIVLAVLVVVAIGLLASCASSEEEPAAGEPTAIVEIAATATRVLESSVAAPAAEPPVAQDNTVAPAAATPAPQNNAATAAVTASNNANQPVPATPEAVATGAGGTVLATRLNVRAGAGTQEAQIGVLTQGTRVQVRGRQGDWLQIAFQGGPGGAGWVSASYVALDGEPTPAAPTAPPRPTPTPNQGSAQRVPAPRALNYQDPTFSWEWAGLGQVTGSPWFFDIQLYTQSGSDPYDVIPAAMAQARQENGVWRFDHRYQARCDSYWVVQIARGAPGNYQGWISERSNRQPIGGTCVEPTPDCPGCGG